MPDEPDDTDMTAEEFMATRETGRPVRVVKSRAEYDEGLSLHPWRVAVDSESVTIGSQRLEGWAVKVQG